MITVGHGVMKDEEFVEFQSSPEFLRVPLFIPPLILEPLLTKRGEVAEPGPFAGGAGEFFLSSFH
jgi:hypothetical protein